MDTTETNISKLQEQFQGAPFGKLVLHHYEQFDKATTNKAVEGTVDLLPAGAKDKSFLEAWVDKGNLYAHDPEIWRRDCGQVLTDITHAARKTLLTIGIEAEDEDLFNMFQIIVMNFAYSFYKSPKNATLVRKALKQSFTQSLFGRITWPLTIGTIVLLFGMIFQKPYLFVPIVTVVCGLLDAVTRSWWTSDQVGEWTNVSVLFKFIFALCNLAAWIGTVASLFLAVWWVL